MKELIEYIAASVVSNPDEVKVTETIGSDDRIVISLEVHPEDKGRVIGRQGQFARAMRSILKVLAIKQNVRVTLEII